MTMGTLDTVFPASDFVSAPAGAQPSAWRHLFSIPVIVVATILLTAAFIFALIGLSALLPALKPLVGGIIEPEVGAHWQSDMVLAGLSYGSAALALFFTVKYLLRRPALSALTSAKRFGWDRFRLGFGVYALTLMADLALNAAGGGLTFAPDFSVQAMGLLLAMALPVLLIQTGAEEALFRGYLMQVLGAARLPPAAIVIGSAALFAAVHMGNPEFAANPVIIIFYFAFGFVLSLVALREGGIELVAGAHFANNLYASAVVRSADSVFQTPALFSVPAISDLSTPEVVVSGLMGPILFWLAYRYLVPARNQEGPAQQVSA